MNARHFLIDEDMGPLRDELHVALERLIAIQMDAYPNDWPEADKREVAEHHLFGKAAQ